MQLVPARSVLQPAVVGVFWIHLCDPVVDGDEHGYAEHDCDGPEDGGRSDEQAWAALISVFWFGPPSEVNFGPPGSS